MEYRVYLDGGDKLTGEAERYASTCIGFDAAIGVYR